MIRSVGCFREACRCFSSIDDLGNKTFPASEELKTAVNCCLSSVAVMGTFCDPFPFDVYDDIVQSSMVPVQNETCWNIFKCHNCSYVTQ